MAEIVKWFIRLIALQAAASILGMTQISAIINSILLWDEPIPPGGTTDTPADRPAPESGR